MFSFLIRYHRPTGDITLKRFDDLSKAMIERFRLEEENTDPDTEIVVISANSEQDLRRSHSRYFSNP